MRVEDFGQIISDIFEFRNIISGGRVLINGRIISLIGNDRVIIGDIRLIRDFMMF
jgi:hypothetical protein